jgi:Transglycosylase
MPPEDRARPHAGAPVIPPSCPAGIAAFMTGIASGSRMRLRVRQLAALAAAVACAGGAWLYQTLPGVGDAPRRVLAELRAHDGMLLPGPPPARVAAAVVAVEDGRYWHHGAADPVAIARALVDSVGHPGRDAGGSTIAQQLPKVLYLRDPAGGLATLRAIGLAFKLAHRYTKSQILSMYPNAIYFGHGHWGIEAASHGYFGVSARRLSWGEASMLAGLPQAPTADDPVSHFAAGRTRQREVLLRLVARGELNAAQAATAYDRTPRPSSAPTVRSRSGARGQPVAG